MRIETKHILTFICMAALALPALARHGEDDPSPTPTPTASPSPTPGDDHGDDDGHHGGGGGSGGGNSGSGSHGKISLHGVYEGAMSNGGIAILYVEKNSQIQATILDVAGQTIGAGEGQMTNGAFTFALSNGQTIAGNTGEHSISGTVAGASFQALRTSEFGEEENAAGRFVGVANGPGGESRVAIVITRSKHIVLVQTTGSAPNFVRTGGFGTVTPPAAPGGAYTFALTKTIGSSSQITGSFTVTDGVFAGAFTTSAGTFTVSSFKSTLLHRMANISTRGLVGQGDGVLIGGFIITGGPKLVMIRAIGPSMAAQGVSPVLANPSLRLFAEGLVLKENDDWKSSANAAEILASGLAPTNDLESALLVRLEPGAYTTIVSGAAAGPIGIGLVEVYEVNHD